ncbi:MAG: hypothetical protein ACMUIL_09400 [bacterium]
MATAGHSAPVVGAVVNVGAKAAVGQKEGTAKLTDVAGNRGAVGKKLVTGVGAKVGVKVGSAGVNDGATVGVKVGAKVGVSVGSVGAKVEANGHNMAAGKTAPPVTGNVGAVVGVNVAVGHSEMPPSVEVGKVEAKGKVGAARVVNPGASVVVVGNVEKGGRITAGAYDDTRLKIAINSKLMYMCLNGLIYNSP